MSIHSQWRAFFCAYETIPSLVSILKPNTIDTIAARANALAALMNGSCASEDTAKEVFTEVRDQIHRCGAVAWLVHLMEPKEIFTKVKIEVDDKEKDKEETTSFESNYSKTTTVSSTASQRAALVLQKRSKKTLADHVRERSAGLLVSFKNI